MRPLLALTHFGSLPEWPRPIAGSQWSTSLTTLVLLRSFHAPGAATSIPDSEQRSQCWIKRPAEVTGQQVPTCRRPPLLPCAFDAWWLPHLAQEQQRRRQPHLTQSPRLAGLAGHEAGS